MLSTHWQPLHRGNIGPWTDADVFRQWGPPTIKIVWNGETVPYLEDIPAGAKILWRNYPLSEQFHGGLDLGAARSPAAAEPETEWSVGANGLPQTGSGRDRPATQRAAVSDLPTPEQAAEAYAQNASAVAAYCAQRGVGKERLLFEGPNEYPVWAHGYTGLARLEKRRLELMHAQGLRSVVSNLGVGWPGNTGADTPPVWDWFKAVAATFAAGDYLGAHEYNGFNGVQENWGWWMGRILKCPYKVPVLITESGIDAGVYGPTFAKQGYRNLPGLDSEDAKCVRCQDEMWQYASLIGADGRARETFQYTYDGNRDDWANFDIRTETFLRPFLDRIRTQGLPKPGSAPVQPPVTPPPLNLDALRNLVWNSLYPAGGVAYLPNAAFAKYARSKGYGAPATNEGRYAGYAYQGYTAKILYCRDGDWARILELAW